MLNILNRVKPTVWWNSSSDVIHYYVLPLAKTTKKHSPFVEKLYSILGHISYIKTTDSSSI